MSVLVILLVCACSVWAAPSNVNITQNNVKQSSIFETFILGGSPSDILPYQVSLRLMPELSTTPPPESLLHYCGGALVSKNVVLTTGLGMFVVKSLIAKGLVYAVIGTRFQHFDPKTTFVTSVEDLIIHPFFNPNEQHNDIAVLKLRDLIPIENQNIHPIPMTTAATAAGEKCKISGWGSTSSSAVSKNSEVLQSVIIPIVDINTCQRALTAVGWTGKLRADMMCAGGEKEVKGFCLGDNGGPLVCNGNLAGIVSWAHKLCDTPGLPGVYSSIAYHRNFIEEAMKVLSGAPPPATAPPSTTDKPNSARKPAFGILLNIFGLLVIALTWMSLKLHL